MFTLLKRVLRALPAKVHSAPPVVSKRKGEMPDWARIIATNPGLWDESVRKSAQGPRVLMATVVGGYPQFTLLESALSLALTLRGVRVDTLICDGALFGCLRAKIAGLSPEQLAAHDIGHVMCKGCQGSARAVFDSTGLNQVHLSSLLSAQDEESARHLAQTVPVDQIDSYVLDGIPVGEHSMAGALRYFGVGDIAGQRCAEGVLRAYFESGLRTAYAMRNLLDQTAYDAIVTNHGIYTPHGIINAVARRRNIHTVAWNLAYRKQCAIFSHNDTYHHTLMEEPVGLWDAMDWSPAHEADIMAYLDSRRGGKNDWIWFNRDGDSDMDGFSRDSGIDWSRPVIGMLTNVVWDAQLHYPANAFENMLDWVMQTVDYFAARPDLQLLIRVHPGELAPPGGQTVSRQPVAEAIHSHFGGTLPKNIFIIRPESKVSTYAAMDRCNAVIIYGTKTGVELTAQGSPVIVAGEAWIRNKGLTLDATDADSYFRILDGLPFAERLDAGTMGRARKYAYHFFFRRMVPVPFLDSTPEAWPPYRIAVDTLDELLPGVSPGLDILCDGILDEARPFVYPAEILGRHDLQQSEAVAS
ncbi:MAG: capsule biosynthesis protein [Magnetospirillum sp.]|nr:capsule biosynthesis protein [Magnetospirillum sp.]